MLIRELLLPEFDQEMQSTRKILAALPETLTDYKPHPKSMPLAQLAGHIASLPAQVNRVLENESFEVDISKIVRFMPATRQELLDRLDENMKAAHDKLADATDEQLVQPWTLKINGGVVFTLPRVKVLKTQVISHIVHHRAQLGVYLRLLELPVPGTYGPSADEMNMFAGSGKK